MTEASPSGDRKRRLVVAAQRWLLNPPMRALVWLGLVPGLVLIETRGRRTGRPRRTVVGAHHDGEHLWVIAEQGRHAAWVRNAQADPAVRVRRGRQWHPARAAIIEGDDARARLATWNRPAHARAVQAFGTDLVTVRIDVRPTESAGEVPG